MHNRIERSMSLNSNQVKCFLALAETLNFTKAATRLYMTQPGLSHQIASLETELKTQLFIRNQKRVLLTPAGALLASELSGLQEAGERLIERVQTVGQGYTGELNIGLLEGQWMGADLTDLFRDYMQTYPNIDLRICQGSFGELRRQLQDGRIDAAFSLKFDIDGMDGMTWAPYDKDSAIFAVSRRLPIGQKEVITMEDMQKETFLIISPEDSRAGHEQIIAQFKQFGVNPEKIRFAPNLTTIMLWIEVGLGIGVVNMRSSIASNPDVRLIHEVPLEDASFCIAWRKQNLNPAFSLFLEMLQKQ